jgi:large subunit ribosomal protein L4
MKAEIVNLDNQPAGSIELPDAVFGLSPRRDILHRMVRWQLARRQAGTHKAKDRSEVIGSGRKIVRQKGSGGARHGNKKVPQFRGGGKAFGPKPRSHAIKLPKKFRALALRHALSAKAAAGELVILEEAKLEEPKTALLKRKLTAMGLDNALVIDGAELDGNFVLAAGNLPNIDVLPLAGVNVYDILLRRKLVLTKEAAAGLERRFKGATMPGERKAGVDGKAAAETGQAQAAAG